MKPTVATILTNAVMVLPSLAGEPGKIFDFNLTLPIIASEFLLLMVILDKTVFGPVGKALDDRDALIRSQLAAVGDNSTEVANLIVSDASICPITLEVLLVDCHGRGKIFALEIFTEMSTTVLEKKIWVDSRG